MSRTALDLTPEERATYQVGREWDEAELEARWTQGWRVARTAAQMLREKFGAKRVVLFGSLASRACFTPWSDIDLAVWGIPGDQFYRAVAAVTGMAATHEVDLVDPESCRSGLRQTIELLGIDL